MRRLLLLIALLSVAAFGAAGCGSSGGGASAASELVPAGSVVYGEVTLKPEGDQKRAIDSILSKFPGRGDMLEELLENVLRKSDAPISFKKDVEPWLGDQAGFFVSRIGLTGHSAASAGLIKADDEDKARDALEKSAEGKTEKHDYKDVEYLTDESGEAGAVFDGFLVLGTEAGVKAAIDTAKGGKKLSDDDDFQKAVAEAPGDRLGLLYVNSPEFLRSARESGMPVPGSFEGFFRKPVVATARAEDDGVIVEANVSGEMAGIAGLFGQASDVLTELPADSWLAVGQSDLGRIVSAYADSFGGFLGGRDAVDQQFKAATGLDLQRDVIDWMGDFGVFVRGTTVDELDGALVIETSDEAASARFLDGVKRFASGQGARVRRRSGGFELILPDAPKPIHAFQQDGRVVFAYGDAAARDAVASGDRLGDSADFTSARDSLGDDYDVSMLVLAKPILDLVDSTSAASDPDWQKARPYLEPLAALVAGTSGDGDSVRSAFKLIVK